MRNSTKYLIAILTVLSVGDCFAGFKDIPVGRGYNIQIENKSNEVVKFEVREDYEPDSKVVEEALLQKGRLFTRLEGGVLSKLKQMQVKDSQGRLINNCILYNLTGNSQKNNLLRITIDENKVCTREVTNFPVTNPDAVIYPGTNFSGVTPSGTGSTKFSILNIKEINLPLGSIVQIALDLDENSVKVLSNLKYGFGLQGNSGSSTNNSCAGAVSSDKSINSYAMVLTSSTALRCLSHARKVAVTPRNMSYCNAPATPGVSWSECDKTNFSFLAATDINSGQLEWTKIASNIQGKDLRNVNFKNLEITKPGIEISAFRRPDWANSVGSLTGADFSYSKALNSPKFVGFISGVKFVGTDLSGSKIDDVNYNIRNGFSCSDSFSPRCTDFYKSDLSEATLDNVKWRSVLAHETKFLRLVSAKGSDLSNSDLYKAVFDGSNLDEANFSHIRAHEASFRALKSAEGTNFSNSDLYKDVFDGSDLDHASFSHSRAHEASFRNLKSAERANFSNSDLYKAVFDSSNLDQVNFYKANLSWADLSNVKSAHGANFSEANLTKVDLRGANLSYSTLKNIDINVIYNAEPATCRNAQYSFITRDRVPVCIAIESFKVNDSTDLYCSEISIKVKHLGGHETVVPKEEVVNLFNKSGVRYNNMLINGMFLHNGAWYSNVDLERNKYCSDISK